MPEDDRGSALITGARGIGAAVARALAADGWPVCVTYRTGAQEAEALRAELVAAGVRAIVTHLDVTDAASVDRACSEAERELGPIGALVANAGVLASEIAATQPIEDFAAVLETNVVGTQRCIQRVLMPMVRARRGRIVLIGSLAAQKAVPGQSAYGASKAALEGLARSVAVEVARRGVTVNVVAPGLIDTELIRAENTGVDPARIPMRRMGSPDDVAACVRFLVSEDAGYVTGSVLTVDGGLSFA